MVQCRDEDKVKVIRQLITVVGGVGGPNVGSSKDYGWEKRKSVRCGCRRFTITKTGV